MKQFLSSLILGLILVSNLLADQESSKRYAFINGDHEIELTHSEIKELEDIIVISEDEVVSISEILFKDQNIIFIKTKEKLDFTKVYKVKFDGIEIKAKPHWKAIDASYSYNGELGVSVKEQATEFKLWAPLASEVTLNLFYKGLDEESYQTVKLERGNKGVWQITLPENLEGKFYSYTVTNFGKETEVLDPYAKSLAATTQKNMFSPRGAIVTPSIIGSDLQFARVKGYQKREDAIIWEINVRDFTSDPSLQTNATFGTYSAFTERLDYISQLGVTHIQLLPVLSYTYSDELNRERDLEYKLGANYNWGYGPDNYFSPDGMYSEDPQNPELRIRELKNLVNEIHNKGMAVTLDVVYNHTAKLSFLEDIVPGYYHFMDIEGKPKQSYGGGRLGSTHSMVRKLIVDSIIYWTKEYKVDGFRFDLMGDLDAETIQLAFNEAKKINPNLIMVGEGWRTFAGDDGEIIQAADQDWMNETNDVASFSDEFRNELKSGYGFEGEPRFITGGARAIQTIFNNVIAKPSNMNEDDPGDVLQYLVAHDGLTLHDVITKSIKKDPELAEEEIHARIRLGNALLLTSQGIPFIHAGQEYGRTKQWKSSTIPEREFEKVDGIKYPYFIFNSYDASDAVNMFDWEKVMKIGIPRKTLEYTKGLIALRKSSDAFRLESEELIQKNVSLIQSEQIGEVDLVLFYKTTSTKGETFYILINADSIERIIDTEVDLTSGMVLVDKDEAGNRKVTNLNGAVITSSQIKVDPLTVIIIKSAN